MEAEETHDTVAHAQETPETATGASAMAGKGGDTPWFLAGIITIGGAVAVGLTPVGELAASVGLRAAGLALFGCGLLCCGAVMRRLSRLEKETVNITNKSLEIRPMLTAVEEEIARVRASMPDPAAIGEAAAHQMHNSMQNVLLQLEQLSDAVAHAAACVEAVRTKVEEAERARLTLAGTLDSMNARIERLQRESNDSRKVNITNEMDAIRQALAGLDRESRARANDQFESVELLQLTMREMEKKLCDHLDQTSREIQKGMQQLPQRGAGMRSETPSDLMGVSEPETVAAAAAAEESRAPAPTITEGPREARTVLSAIDKLRALRGM